MTLSQEQLKEVRKVAKSLSLNIKITKEIGNGFWVDECGSSISGFIQWLIDQAKLDEQVMDAARYGILLSKFEIETSTDSALLLTYLPYCESKWVAKSAIIIVNGNSVVPYSALKCS